jgi:tricorn protease
MASQIKGYYRYPTICGDKIVFVAEDDLWLVQAAGGSARRLTANLGAITHPFFSPDGEWLAFIGREEGHAEVYLVPAAGGPAKRLTFLGSNSMVVGWHEQEIVFACDVGQPFRFGFRLYTVDVEGNELRRLPFGPARNASWGEKGLVIGRNTGDPARWKRYRGGTAGEIWIDAEGSGEFHRLVELEGNLANPMWIGERIYFIADHQGVGNIYSSLPNGRDLKQHTEHGAFYARNASTDGRRIVYHAGADIYLLDPSTDESQKVAIDYFSPHIQRNRKFVDAGDYLEDYALGQDGSMLALVQRGKTFTLGNWAGPTVQHGLRNGVRYRLTRWLKDGQRVVLVSDEDGEDHLELQWTDGAESPKKLSDLDVGRPQEIKVSPVNDEIVMTNHRHELIRVDLEAGTLSTIEQSKYGPIEGFDWSPDGNWVAYSCTINRRMRVIKIYSVETGQIHLVTEPVLFDYAPVFDPTGKYLYFLSCRVFNPVYDQMHFDLNFPKGTRPYAITLRKDVPAPFVPRPRGFEAKKEDENESEKADEAAHETVEEVVIDFDGIQERVVAFPVEEGLYEQIAAVKDKVFYTVHAVEGALDMKWFDREPAAKACLKVYDMDKLEEGVFVDRLTNFKLSGDGSAVACRIGNRLRVIRAKREPDQELPDEDKPGRKSGWIDLARVRVSIEPMSEWRQMLRETWRLQRDYFWVEDMSGVDWPQVLHRYEPLVERVAARSEFSDLLWEMQGELGTSHAYELGGDYRPEPEYRLGFLAADLAYDPDHDAYRFTHIPTGDVWDAKNAPPLKRPGVNIEAGMLLLGIGGQRLSKDNPPNRLLVNQAGQEVQLNVAEGDGSAPRSICVKTVADETLIRYRDWVERNRQYVHEKTEGQVGYIHIPDMGPRGYAEFHRYFLAELDHRGLIIDVRFNGGGHVSALLLEKLARQRLGYDLTRWMGDMPYPDEAVYGPMVALTNELAGSDGDIFCHSFKLMKLGKLIGRRTWGGVIGIWPRNWLVDGTLTTQPEFSFWFKDTGWGVENYGTDPDITVDITPQAYAQGQDTQLERAIQEVLQDIEKNPPLEPNYENRPERTLPG